MDNEFDLLVRSAMENAEERVPSRVWASVKAGLPREEAPVVWWKWAASGLATATAILAVVLAVKPSTPETAAPVSPVVAEVSEVAPVREADTPEQTVLLAEVAPTVSNRPVKAVPAVKNTPAGQEQTAPVAEPVAAAETPSTTSQTAAPASSSSEKKSEPTYEPFDDPFARMAYEDAHAAKARKTQFAMNGIVGTNDGQSAIRSAGRLAAPSILTPADGTVISETSESIYGIPLSLGVGVRFYIADRVSIGTGVNYSLLTRTFEGSCVGFDGTKAVKAGDIRHTVHYIGIPANLYFDIVKSDFMEFYLFGGGAAEKAIKNTYNIKTSTEDLNHSEKVDGLQWSTNVGIGVQFQLSDKMGLYLDPSARYYFDCSQPNSIRTRRPFMFGFEAGLRFDL